MLPPAITAGRLTRKRTRLLIRSWNVHPVTDKSVCVSARAEHGYYLIYATYKGVLGFVSSENRFRRDFLELSTQSRNVNIDINAVIQEERTCLKLKDSNAKIMADKPNSHDVFDDNDASEDQDISIVTNQVFIDLTHDSSQEDAPAAVYGSEEEGEDFGKDENQNISKTHDRRDIRDHEDAYRRSDRGEAVVDLVDLTVEGGEALPLTRNSSAGSTAVVEETPRLFWDPQSRRMVKSHVPNLLARLGLKDIVPTTNAGDPTPSTSSQTPNVELLSDTIQLPTYPEFSLFNLRKKFPNSREPNPTIVLNENPNKTSNESPIVSHDSSERSRFKNKGHYDRAIVESEDLQRARDYTIQRRLRKRMAKAEMKARAIQTFKGKWPKVEKIVKAERAFGAPVASLHPDAPNHSTPKRIGLEELRESLRHCVQHCTVFFNMNGQPSLSPGTWPDHLSWAEARKAYRRNYDIAAAGHPSLIDDLEHPSVYDTSSASEIEDETAEDSLARGKFITRDEEIPHHDDAREPEPVPEPELPSGNGEGQLANQIPTTSNAVQPARMNHTAKTIGVAFPMDKYGSFIGHGIATFKQGISTDNGIEACLEKIARQTTLKYALNNANISVKAAFLARQEVANQIAKYQDRLQYLTGQRRRLVQVLITQQEKLEQNLRSEIEPTLSQLGLTLNDTGVLDQEVVLVTEASRDCPVVEQNSSGADPLCTCPGDRCLWYGECRSSRK